MLKSLEAIILSVFSKLNGDCEVFCITNEGEQLKLLVKRLTKKKFISCFLPASKVEVSIDCKYKTPVVVEIQTIKSFYHDNFRCDPITLQFILDVFLKFVKPGMKSKYIYDLLVKTLGSSGNVYTNICFMMINILSMEGFVDVKELLTKLSFNKDTQDYVDVTFKDYSYYSIVTDTKMLKNNLDYLVNIFEECFDCKLKFKHLLNIYT